MSVKSLNFDNFTAANTSEAEFKNYCLNQNIIVKEANSLLWQPETDYAQGQIIRSSAMPVGTIAKCTTAGKSGTVEPEWDGVTEDNTVVWTLINETLTSAQIAAVNSGITAQKVAEYNALSATKQDVLTAEQQDAVNSGITKELVETAADYPDTIPESDNFKGAEICYLQGSSATINLSNGRIFYCTGTSVTLPEVKEGVTVTIISTAATVTWSGDIKWHNGTAPVFSGNCHITTFIGYGGYWYGG